MHINWLGQTCVKLQTKNLDEDITVLIDPYRPAKGDFPRSLASNLALFSGGRENSITLSQNPFIVDTLGEFENKGVIVYAVPCGENNFAFSLSTESLVIVHLGRLNKKIENGQMEKLGSPDILFVPVGNGKQYLNAEDAASVVTELEPRVVIPIAHKCDTDPNADSVNDFIKAMGLKPEITDKKIIIKKKDLPQEEMKLYILEKNY